jgi:hypothetical protein
MSEGGGPFPEVSAVPDLNPLPPANRRLGSRGVWRADRGRCPAEQWVKPEPRQAQKGKGDFPVPILLSVFFLVVTATDEAVPAGRRAFTL